LIAAGVLLAGCGWSGGASVPGGSWAPQVTSSFPDSGIQDLGVGTSLTFAAGGEDVDSLELSWEWLLNDRVEASGESSTGSFYTEWTLVWSEELPGLLSDVTFVVRDPEGNATELYWPIQGN
jgi:hypothetical protein